jgi:hypothetical protein
MVGVGAKKKKKKKKNRQQQEHEQLGTWGCFLPSRRQQNSSWRLGGSSRSNGEEVKEYVICTIMSSSCIHLDAA